MSAVLAPERCQEHQGSQGLAEGLGEGAGEAGVSPEARASSWAGDREREGMSLERTLGGVAKMGWHIVHSWILSRAGISLNGPSSCIPPHLCWDKFQGLYRSTPQSCQFFRSRGRNGRQEEEIVPLTPHRPSKPASLLHSSISKHLQTTPHSTSRLATAPSLGAWKQERQGGQ